MRKSSVTRRIFDAMLGTKQQKSSQEKVIKHKRRLLMESLEDRRVFAGIAEGNIAVYRVGTGAAALTNAGTAVFIDEYTPAGVLVQTIEMPTAVDGANQQLVSSGTATSEGMISFSPDGQFLTMTGYGANVGTAGIAGTSSATVKRVVGVLDASTGVVDTSTAIDSFTANNIRSAITTDGTNIWVAGNGNATTGGVRHTTLGGTTSTLLSDTTTNIRTAGIFDNQLFVSASSGTTRLATIGTGLPTTSGQALTNLPGISSANSGGPNQFFMADLDAGVAGVDTLYVSDDTRGLSKYSLVAGTWVSNGSIAGTFRGLSGVASDDQVALFATLGANLVTFADTSGYNAALSGNVTQIASPGTNRAFRGIAVRPLSATVAPALSPISDIVAPNNLPKAVKFIVNDVDSTQGSLTFEMSSSDQSIIRNASLSVIGSGPERDLRYVPEVGATGTVTITLTVRDELGQSATESFEVMIVPSQLTISLDLDPLTDGIQSTGTFATDDTIDVSVWLTLTGQASVSAYNFSIQYDTNELDFVDGSRVETPPAPMEEFDATNETNDGLGLMFSFDGLTVGNGPSAPFSAVIATFQMLAAEVAGGIDDIDLIAGRFNPGFDDFFANDLPVTSNSPADNDLFAYGLVAFEGASITTGSTVTDPTITVTSGDKVYDGGAYVPTTTVTGSSGDVTNPALTYTYFVGAGTGGTSLGANAPIDVGTYTVVASFAGNENYNPGTAQKTFNITPKALTAESAAADKVYDGNTSASVTITLLGVVAGDVVSGSATGAFDTKNVGVDKPVTVGGVTLGGADAGNYTVGAAPAAVADITALALTANSTATDKVYDGNTSASVTITLVGALAGDDVSGSATGTFDTKNVGVDKPVTVGAVTLGGADAGNYTVGAAPASVADITALALTATSTATDKVYDGNTSASVTITLVGAIAGDDVSGSATGTFDTKNVGVDKPVTVGAVTLGGTDAGNYTVGAAPAAVADITALALTATSTANDKVYDGNTSASVTITLVGAIAGDDVSGSATGNFDTKNVGVDKPVTVGVVTLGGLDAGNYTVGAAPAAIADVTALTIVGQITANDKTFDGNTSATIATRTLVGAIAGDDVQYVGGVANFDTPDVGNDKLVTATGLSLSGADAGNYLVNSTATTLASIFPPGQVDPVVTIVSGDKVYDGLAYSPVTTVSGSAGDVSNPDIAYTYFVGVGTGGTSLGSDAPSDAGTYTVVAAFAGNASYNPGSAEKTFLITPKELTPTAVAADKVYDGNTSAVVTVTLDGVVVGDTVDGSAAGTFANKNVGNNKTVSVGPVTLGGADAGNYTVASAPSTEADITPLAIVGSVTVLDKVFDGNTTATIDTRTLSGVITGDDVEYVGGVANFDTPDVGNDKPVLATGLSLSGADAGNYVANDSATTIANIFAAPQVLSVGINQATGTPAELATLQKSMLVNLLVTFSEPVVLLPGAFKLQNVSISPVVTLSESQIIVTPSGVASDTFVITFGAGDSVITRANGGGNTLGDGSYRLTVDATKVESQGSGAPMAADYAFGPGSLSPGASADKFFRFFGDIDGDGDVDGFDLQTYRAATIPDTPVYNPLVDFDGDGVVKNDLADRNAFLASLKRKFRL